MDKQAPRQLGCGVRVVLSMKYGFLTKCEIKMAGYWPSSFLACLSTESKSRSINPQKSMRTISSHLDRTSLVNKGFIIWDKTPKHDKFSLGDKALSRAGKNFYPKVSNTLFPPNPSINLDLLDSLKFLCFTSNTLTCICFGI